MIAKYKTVQRSDLLCKFVDSRMVTVQGTVPTMLHKFFVGSFLIVQEHLTHRFFSKLVNPINVKVKYSFVSF